MDNPRQPLPTTIVNPQLNVIHLKLLDCHGSRFPDLGALDAGMVEESSPHDVQLAHLHVIPPTPDNNGTSSTTYVVVAVFTATRDQYSMAPQHQTSFSTIVRWEVVTSEPTLHESFKALESGREKAANSTVNTPYALAANMVADTHSLSRHCAS